MMMSHAFLQVQSPFRVLLWKLITPIPSLFFSTCTVTFLVIYSNSSRSKANNHFVVTMYAFSSRIIFLLIFMAFFWFGLGVFGGGRGFVSDFVVAVLIFIWSNTSLVALPFLLKKTPPHRVQVKIRLCL